MLNFKLLQLAHKYNSKTCNNILWTWSVLYFNLNCYMLLIFLLISAPSEDLINWRKCITTFLQQKGPTIVSTSCTRWFKSIFVQKWNTSLLPRELVQPGIFLDFYYVLFRLQHSTYATCRRFSSICSIVIGNIFYYHHQNVVNYIHHMIQFPSLKSLP